MTPTSDAAAATKRTTTDVVRIAFENKRRTLTAVSLVSAFNGVVDKRRSTDSDQPTRVSAVDRELTIVTNSLILYSSGRVETRSAWYSLNDEQNVELDRQQSRADAAFGTSAERVRSLIEN